MIRSAAFVLLCACASAPSITEHNNAREDSQRWDPNRESPSDVLDGEDTRLSFTVTAADVGGTFGVRDADVPYPDTYWPFVNNGIDEDWSHSGSPLKKFMNTVDPAQTAAAANWEHQNHGADVPGVSDWWGHCPGWTAAAMLNKPILHAVDAKLSDGAFVACSAGSPGCAHFEIGDLNALMAEVYVDAQSSFIGNRCDTPPNRIVRDADGRIMQNGCKGLNAGSLLVILGNHLRAKHLPIAIDAQNDGNTDQIWNQPAYRYTVYRYLPLSEADATALVKNKDQPNPNYTWDADARGFVFVDIGLWWVSEAGPNKRVVSGLESSREMRVTAVIELDGPETDRNARIIGGEYIADPAAKTTRLTVPPFVWVATAAGPETLPLSVNGDYHNPYIRPSLVAQLVALGTH